MDYTVGHSTEATTSFSSSMKGIMKAEMSKH